MKFPIFSTTDLIIFPVLCNYLSVLIFVKKIHHNASLLLYLIVHVCANPMLEESKNNQIWKCCQIAVNLYFGSFRSLELPYNKNLSLTSTSAEN